MNQTVNKDFSGPLPHVESESGQSQSNFRDESPLSIFIFILSVILGRHYPSYNNIWTNKYTSSFHSVTREKEFKRSIRNPEIPIVGKYNVKYDSTERRVQGASFSKFGKSTMRRKMNISASNASPICGRMIRALNANPDRDKRNYTFL